MSSRIPEMLNDLHAMISEAWGVPLGAEKCVIERGKALDIIDEIRATFPTEIAEAKRLLDARADFISNAKREAEQIKRTAEQQARQLVDEQQIIKISRAKSNEMLSYAETHSNELRRAANEYVDDAMLRTEQALGTAIEEIRSSRARFRQSAKATAEIPLTSSHASLGATATPAAGVAAGATEEKAHPSPNPIKDYDLEV